MHQDAAKAFYGLLGKELGGGSKTSYRMKGTSLADVTQKAI